ncbi:hypothetical protein [Paraburkholderia sp. J8-2]|uniref:hypothetical protein n=1 Tax=Paraburkholderia sp. J8-2 TaxID=2805440 RepID=UPI002AB63807|nr:hypothetical protein [Paraburkholderia sp. J8-2]
MKKMAGYSRIVAAGLALLLIESTALAAPTRCSEGFQDSSCETPIASPVQTPVTCPASTATVGVITETPAKWQGSYYSLPQCVDVAIPPNCTQAEGPGYYNTANWTWNGSAWTGQTCAYAAPPTCPPGQTQRTAPTWDGGEWTGQVCQQSIWTPSEAANACLEKLFGVNDPSQLVAYNSILWNDYIVPEAVQSGDTITYRYDTGGGEPDGNGEPTCGDLTWYTCVAQLDAQTATETTTHQFLGSCNQAGSR